jgi:hypothetical protein
MKHFKTNTVLCLALVQTVLSRGSQHVSSLPTPGTRRSGTVSAAWYKLSLLSWLWSCHKKLTSSCCFVLLHGSARLIGKSSRVAEAEYTIVAVTPQGRVLLEKLLVEDRVVRIPASYSGGAGFKSWPGYRLSWQWIFLVRPGKCRDSTSN